MFCVQFVPFFGSRSIYLKDGLRKRQLKIPSSIEIVKKAGLWHENSFAAELITVLERDGVQGALALIQNRLKTNASSSPDNKRRDESISEKAELSTQRYQGPEEILKAIEEHKSYSKNLGKGVIQLILQYLSGQNVILSDDMAMLMRKEGLIGENNLLNPSLVKSFDPAQMRLKNLLSSWSVKNVASQKCVDVSAEAFLTNLSFQKIDSDFEIKKQLFPALILNLSQGVTINKNLVKTFKALGFIDESGEVALRTRNAFKDGTITSFVKFFENSIMDIFSGESWNALPDTVKELTANELNMIIPYEVNRRRYDSGDLPDNWKTSWKESIFQDVLFSLYWGSNKISKQPLKEVLFNNQIINAQGEIRSELVNAYKTSLKEFRRVFDQYAPKQESLDIVNPKDPLVQEFQGITDSYDFGLSLGSTILQDTQYAKRFLDKGYFKDAIELMRVVIDNGLLTEDEKMFLLDYANAPKGFNNPNKTYQLKNYRVTLANREDTPKKLYAVGILYHKDYATYWSGLKNDSYILDAVTYLYQSGEYVSPTTFQEWINRNPNNLSNGNIITSEPYD